MSRAEQHWGIFSITLVLFLQLLVSSFYNISYFFHFLGVIVSLFVTLMSSLLVYTISSKKGLHTISLLNSTVPYVLQFKIILIESLFMCLFLGTAILT